MTKSESCTKPDKIRALPISMASLLCWIWGGLTLLPAMIIMRNGVGEHFLEYFIIMLLTGIGLVYVGWAVLKMRPWAGWLGIVVSLVAVAVYCKFPILFFPWILVALISGPLTIISILGSNLKRIQNPAAPVKNALPLFALLVAVAIGIMAAIWFWTAPRAASHHDEPGRFSRSPNGTVVDTITGLEWHLGPLTEWELANQWAAELNVDGGGFRLPVSSELAGLYQMNPTGNHIDPAFAAPDKFNWVWTSARHDGYLVKLLGADNELLSMGGVFYFHSGGKGWNYIGPGHKCYTMAVRSPKRQLNSTPE